MQVYSGHFIDHKAQEVNQALLESSGFNVIYVCQLCVILSFHCHIYDIIVLNKLILTQSKHISEEL